MWASLGVVHPSFARFSLLRKTRKLSLVQVLPNRVIKELGKVLPLMNLHTVYQASLSLFSYNRVFLNPFASTWVIIKDHILLIDQRKRYHRLLWRLRTTINLNDYLLIFMFIKGKWLCYKASFGNDSVVIDPYSVIIDSHFIIKSFYLSLK